MPYFFMICSNLLLAYDIIFMQTSIQVTEDSINKRKSLSITILIITTVFIVFTLPDNIMNAFFLPILFSVDYGYHLLFFCDCLAFTFHGLHFIILIVSNKLFKKELKLMLKSLKLSSKVDHTSVSNFHRAHKNTTTV